MPRCICKRLSLVFVLAPHWSPSETEPRFGCFPQRTAFACHWGEGGDPHVPLPVRQIMNSTRLPHRKSCKGRMTCKERHVKSTFPGIANLFNPSSPAVRGLYSPVNLPTFTKRAMKSVLAEIALAGRTFVAWACHHPAHNALKAAR